jgi:hypothetical protein
MFENWVLRRTTILKAVTEDWEKYCLRNLKRRDKSEDKDIKWTIILNQILKK